MHTLREGGCWFITPHSDLLKIILDSFGSGWALMALQQDQRAVLLRRGAAGQRRAARRLTQEEGRDFAFRPD